MSLGLFREKSKDVIIDWICWITISKNQLWLRSGWILYTLKTEGLFLALGGYIQHFVGARIGTAQAVLDQH